jgi:hypothetical protein
MTAETATERGADWEPTACILCECNCGILGLKWEDVDLEGGRIHVRRSLWRGKLITPKSRRFRRAINMYQLRAECAPDRVQTTPCSRPRRRKDARPRVLAHEVQAIATG